MRERLNNGSILKLPPRPALRQEGVSDSQRALRAPVQLPILLPLGQSSDLTAFVNTGLQRPAWPIIYAPPVYHLKALPFSVLNEVSAFDIKRRVNETMG